MVFSFQYVFQKSKQCICIYTYIHTYITLHSIPLHYIPFHSIPYHTIHTYIYIYVYTYINKSKQYKQSAIMVSHVHHIHQEFVKKKRVVFLPKKKNNGRCLGGEEVPFLCREDQTLEKVLGIEKSRRNHPFR